MVPMLVAMALGASDPAPQSAPDVDLITDPRWVARPSGESLARAYPAKALRDGFGGRGTITCRVTAKGNLKACVVEDESSPGFGQAVLEVAYYFRMAPVTLGGKPVEGRTVRIPLVWRHPNDAPAR